MAERLPPLQEKHDADVLSALLFREVDELAQDAFRRAQVISEAAPDAEIATEF
jgi:hypothetical protein